MGWIEWNGVRSDSMGLVVERMPGPVRAKLRTEEKIVPGRSGVMHTGGDSYEMVSLPAILNVMNSEDESEIHAWLKGKGTLITSDDPTKCYRGIIINELTRTRQRPFGRCYDSISVIFDCDPYQYEAVPSVLTLTQPGIITGSGTADALPLISISGSGDGTVMVNGASVLVDDLVSGAPVLLDCENRMAYTQDGGVRTSANARVTVLDNEWPVLTPGSNTVSWSGGVTGLTITPNWRWL